MSPLGVFRSPLSPFGGVLVLVLLRPQIDDQLGLLFHPRSVEVLFEGEKFLCFLSYSSFNMIVAPGDLRLDRQGLYLDARAP